MATMRVIKYSKAPVRNDGPLSIFLSLKASRTKCSTNPAKKKLCNKDKIMQSRPQNYQLSAPQTPYVL